VGTGSASNTLAFCVTSAPGERVMGSVRVGVPNAYWPVVLTAPTSIRTDIVSIRTSTVPVFLTVTDTVPRLGAAVETIVALSVRVSRRPAGLWTVNGRWSDSSCRGGGRVWPVVASETMPENASAYSALGTAPASAPISKWKTSDVPGAIDAGFSVLAESRK